LGIAQISEGRDQYEKTRQEGIRDQIEWMFEKDAAS